MYSEKVFKALLDFAVRESFISLSVMDPKKLKEQTMYLLKGFNPENGATRDEVEGQSHIFYRDTLIAKIMELWFPCVFQLPDATVRGIDFHDKIEEILMTM